MALDHNLLQKKENDNNLQNQHEYYSWVGRRMTLTYWFMSSTVLFLCFHCEQNSDDQDMAKRESAQSVAESKREYGFEARDREINRRMGYLLSFMLVSLVIQSYLTSMWLLVVTFVVVGWIMSGIVKLNGEAGLL